MELYTLYYQEYNLSNYSDYLQSIKFLRNAAAHSNCLMSSNYETKGREKISKDHQVDKCII